MQLKFSVLLEHNFCAQLWSSLKFVDLAMHKNHILFNYLLQSKNIGRKKPGEFGN